MEIFDNAVKQNNVSAYCQLFVNTMVNGLELRPRGALIKEIRDAQITLDPRWPFQGFKNRKYNLAYFKAEMRWKLGANKYDDSIKALAKMWESVQNPDKTFNSNYGQYWFGQQMGLMKAVLELIRDKDSRRASIPMLTDAHLSPETRDTVCTEAVTLHIRETELHMSVHMRSSDQIFGLGTDVPTFSTLLMMAHGLLRETYPSLRLGRITITAASSHIYERHFEMVRSILQESLSDYQHHILPECSGTAEALALIADRGSPRSHVPSSWHLYRFIHG